MDSHSQTTIPKPERPLPQLPRLLEVLVQNLADWKIVVQIINDQVMPIHAQYRSCCQPIAAATPTEADAAAVAAACAKKTLEIKKELLDNLNLDLQVAPTSFYTLAMDGIEFTSAPQQPVGPLLLRRQIFSPGHPLLHVL